MGKNTKFAEEYVREIIEDIPNRIVKEEPEEYTDSKITRVYEFEDGAVVRYEWQDVSAVSKSSEHFNHRFTLLKPPSPNPHKLRKSVVKVINYS